jgi:predicted enzyme related to lactoylglutathione lyase
LTPACSAILVDDVPSVILSSCSSNCSHPDADEQPPASSGATFQKVPEGKTMKNRLHLDIGVSDIAAAIGQAEALGAQRVGGIHGDTAGSFQVLLDPEGNEWCLVQPA